MPFEITFVTGNLNKCLEARAILSGHVIVHQESLDLEEIQGVELEQVARHKLIEAYNKLKRPLFCEDTGLYIDALNGFPGALIKHYLERIGSEGICRLHGGSRAYGKTVLGYHDGKVMHFFEGVVEGVIAERTQGEGFGWSSLFIPHIDGVRQPKSFAQIPIALKNKISMRSIALRAMLSHLQDLR